MESHITFFPMGTFAHVTLYGIENVDLKKYRYMLESLFNDWNRTFSRFEEDSELAELNAKAGEWVEVSDRMFRVLQKCLVLFEESNGVFDPSVGSFLAAAGYGLPVNFKLPKIVPTCLDIRFNENRKMIRCKKGQILEPAAIVKGMAIDEAAKVLNKVSGWLINVGGDILTQGSYGIQEKWRIGIQHHEQKDKLLTIIGLKNCALATSGTYAVKKASWNHQISVKGGKSLDEISSLSVIANSSYESDAISSIATLLGIQEGLEYLEFKKVPYFMVDKRNKVYKNSLFSELEVN